MNQPVVPIQLTFIVVTAALAALVGLGALLAVLRGRVRDEEVAERGDLRLAGDDHADLPTKYEAAEAPSRDAPLVGAEGHAAYESVLRILWWLTIAIVLVGVGLSNAFATNQPLIFGIGGLGVVAVLVLHELLPERWRSPITSGLEALIALALVTGLLLVTGYGSSPFFFAFDIVAVAVALGHGGRVAFMVAAVATLAYLGVLFLDPARATYSGGDLLRFGLNVGSIWLLAYLAGVFAAQERRVRAWLQRTSLIDPLTGLFNRSQIYTTLEQEVRRTRRSARGFCLLMIDLDGLKAVNDQLGHHRGDQVLRALGTVIRRSIRTVDTAYRYGGDEFLVLLPETDIAGAFVVAEKIRAGAEELGDALAGGPGTETSVSIGLVSHPEDGLAADELVIAADRAMYEAKSLGKNQISGVPRVRRAVPRHLPAPVESTSGGIAVAVGPAEAEDEQAAPPPVIVTPPPVEPVAAAVAEPVPAGVAEPVAAAVAESVAATPGAVPHVNGSGEATDEREPDPAEFRRQIAAARRSFDPDHQIRRAMDAFLSPPTPREEKRPQHDA
ncbi:MAG TPA: GGDEF domain-containing protein [Candidatus Limnocylindria bacterium]|nr:GGDEF domain-containing protein [Candidatus Limnocylindria bacterium]